MPTRFLLARHGNIHWSGRMGAVEDGLNDLGRRQAEALGERLAHYEIAALYSSTLKRAIQTAEIISARTDLAIVPESRLREWDPGEWTGLTEDEVRARDAAVWEAFRGVETEPDFVIPGAETFGELQRRVVAVAKEIATVQPDGITLLVSHGGALGALIHHALGLGFARGREPFLLENCSLSIVEFAEERVSLVSLNDTCHLDGLGRS